jgi:hypothetical protein
MAETYPYLVANLVALPLLIAQFVVAGPQRAAMFASGALFTPWGALAPLLSDYWSPARVGGLPMGIEDFVISFQTGAAIWFWASLPVRQTIVVDLRLLPMVAKSACFAVGFLAAAAVLAAIGVSAITQVIVLPAILATILLQSRPSHWRFALSAAVCYTLWYCMLLLVLYSFLPNLAAEWRTGQFWTISVLGLPLGEIVWALVGSTAHALLFANIARARFREPLPAR